jgi:hypothetical protein
MGIIFTKPVTEIPIPTIESIPTSENSLNIIPTIESVESIPTSENSLNIIPTIESVESIPEIIVTTENILTEIITDFANEISIESITEVVPTEVVLSIPKIATTIKDDPILWKNKRISKLVTQNNYSVKNIDLVNSGDLAGFCAAGFIVTNKKKQFLVIKEQRNVNGKIKVSLNFIGGKRDRILETPLKTAIREFGEETLNSFTLKEDNVTPLLYMWFSQSKYFLIHIEYDGDICLNDNLEWLDFSIYNLKKFHSFSGEMVTMCKNKIFDKALFDKALLNKAKFNKALFNKELFNVKKNKYVKTDLNVNK